MRGLCILVPILHVMSVHGEVLVCRGMVAARHGFSDVTDRSYALAILMIKQGHGANRV
jgi:hypothetical protein